MPRTNTDSDDIVQMILDLARMFPDRILTPSEVRQQFDLEESA